MNISIVLLTFCFQEYDKIAVGKIGSLALEHGEIQNINNLSSDQLCVLKPLCSIDV